MSTEKKYWNSLEHLQEESAFMEKAQNEFAEKLPVDEFLAKEELSTSTTTRRDFLKFLGFSLSAATLAACETPIVKSIPYVVKPEEITPGVANYYASTFYDGVDFSNILVKTREGRPIHIEGNKESIVTKGSVNARVNSSVLSLYDTKRYQNPMADGAASSWSDVDSKIANKLASIKNAGGNISILSNTVISPSMMAAINQFTSAFSNEDGTNVSHIMYDAISASGMLDANEADFGKRAIPDYKFNKANVIVGVGADFLGNWLNSIEYATDYASNRVPSKSGMSKHYQFEATMSLTGSNADIRGAVRASDYGAVAIGLYNAVAKLAGGVTAGIISYDDDNGVSSKINDAAKDLWKNKGKSLVVCGSNDSNVQSVVNGINNLLGNYGSTIDLKNSVNTRQGNDTEVATLVSEMKTGSIDALIIMGTDPAYTLPASLGFADAMSKVGLKVSLSSNPNSTSALCDFVCPDNHYLESWNDFYPKSGVYTVAQPTINKIFNSRQAGASLLKWSGLGDDFYGFMKSVWADTIFPMQSSELMPEAFWNKAVHDGFTSVNEPTEMMEITYNGNAVSSASSVKGGSSDWEVELYVETAMGDGSQAGNPWLQELPHPVTKVVWDNYITMNPTDAIAQGYETRTGEATPANTATVNANGVEVTLPVVALPGQKIGTVGIAVGYGNTEVEGRVVGANVFPMLMAGKSITNAITGASITNTGETYPIASTQTHHTMMGRKIVNETSLETFQSQSRDVWNAETKLVDTYGNSKHVRELDLWEGHPIEKGHRWGMSIDLNLCIGCGSCVTACHSENNVPVVGKDEVRRTRTMSWMRIDRYFSSDADPKRNNGEKNYDAMELPSAYPEVVYQPLMCQHCNHAPCETVCPVAATTHSNEGLNQMAYNRCVGTRYCANNCPFKVRRFNWFDYPSDFKFSNFNPSQDDLGKLVLNPDVTVRSRGVMEKCSMCVQRIQAGKLDAKKKSEPVQNGAIQTACSGACPTHAITFGDLNDERHDASKLSNDERAYNLLEEIGVKPNIYYQTKVRNKPQTEGEVISSGGHA